MTCEIIGGDFCKAEVDSRLLPAEDQKLSRMQEDMLWCIFVEIGKFWNDVHPKAPDSAHLRSSWLEFIAAKTQSDPSYVAEYANAAAVVSELLEVYGEEYAFAFLFQKNGIPDGPPLTRLAHAKRFVVDEFIQVNVVAGGFKRFLAKDKTNDGKGKPNYRGFLGGSRSKRRPRVRAYLPEGPDK